MVSRKEVIEFLARMKKMPIMGSNENGYNIFTHEEGLWKYCCEYILHDRGIGGIEVVYYHRLKVFEQEFGDGDQYLCSNLINVIKSKN